MVSHKTLRFLLVCSISFFAVSNVRADALEAAGMGMAYIFGMLFAFALPIVLALIFIILRFATNKPALSIGVYLPLGLATASSGLAYLEGLSSLPLLAIITVILIYGTIDIIVMRRTNRF